MVSPAFKFSLILFLFALGIEVSLFGLSLDLSGSMYPFLCYDSRNSGVSRPPGIL